MDFAVESLDELQRHRARAEALGARLLHDRTDVTDAPLSVLADPAGHPFCLVVRGTGAARNDSNDRLCFVSQTPPQAQYDR